MPELPEVETICNGLRPFLQGNTIDAVTMCRTDLRFPFPDNFASCLEGNTIIDVTRRAKYIIISLNTEWLWLIHLGMTGQFLITPKDSSIHDHLIISLEYGSLAYRDIRRFGYMDVIPKSKQHESHWLKKLGVEPLLSNFTPTYLYKAIHQKKGAIKPLLLMQNIVAGMGNIYASESLFNANIHPSTPGQDVTYEQSASLVNAIQHVLKKAIKAGGSSLQNYRNTSGNMGYFQHQFYVYSREGKPCFNCQTPITRIIQTGRSTFFCSTCQK